MFARVNPSSCHLLIPVTRRELLSRESASLVDEVLGRNLPQSCPTSSAMMTIRNFSLIFKEPVLNDVCGV